MRRTRAEARDRGPVKAMLVLLLASTWPLAGAAEPVTNPAIPDEEQRFRELSTQASWIEAGFFHNDVDENSPFAYGNYRGLIDDEFYALGNVDIYRRAPWDGDSTQYYRLRGLNLGLSSRYVDAEYGHQGLFGLRFLFDELPVYKTETAETFFQGVGDANLKLPPGWMPGGRADIPVPGDAGYPTAFQTSISDGLRKVDIDWKRRKVGGGFSLVLPASLEFDANYFYESKKGRKLMAGVIAENGGDPRSVILPEAIDYNTQQFDGTLRYGGEDLQLELGYYGSTFDNDNDSLTWQVPYDGSPWDASAGYCVNPAAGGFCGTGRKGQMPDNWFHQILASGGYNLPYRTRVTLSTAFSWMLQNDDFLPYTVNQNLSVPIPLPRNDVNGEIFTTIVDFGVASRPLEKLRLDFGYRYEDRDNDTDRDLYVAVPNDANDQHDMEEGRYNLPYSLTRHQINFDAGYALPLRSELTLGYEWNHTDRDYQERNEVWENTLSAILTGRPHSMVQTRLNYEHTWRDGHDYNGARPFLKSHTSDLIQAEFADMTAPGEDCEGLTFDECIWENHPLLRKSYLADLHHDSIRGLMTVTPLENLSIAANMGWTFDDYHKTSLGLTEYESASPGIDVTWAPFDCLSAYAFYNYQWTRYEQQGWEFTGVDDSMDPTTRWGSTERVKTHTVGAGVNVAVIPEVFDVGVDYLYAKSTGEIDLDLASGLDPLRPYPNTHSRQQNVSVHGEFRLTENLSTRLGYLYSELSTDDYALDGIGPTSLGCATSACVIGAGQKSPDYTSHTVSWSLVYKFW